MQSSLLYSTVSYVIVLDNTAIVIAFEMAC